MNKILEEDLRIIANGNLPYENLDNATVLVTGATGLVGVSLIRALFAIYEKKKINIKIIGLIRDKGKA